jgi:hypothetical protein
MEPVSNEAISLIKTVKCEAIELCAIKPERIDNLENINSKSLTDFKYVSLHAPDITYENSVETNSVLEKIFSAQKKFHFNTIVICPNFVKDWTVFDHYSLPIAFENMDSRKSFGTTIKDIEFILKKKDFMVVLDLTHAYTIEKTTQLAQEFYNKFADLIVETHISGYAVHGEDEQQHYPAHLLKHQEIFKFIPKKVPIIIESVWPKVDKENKNEILREGLKKEFELVKKNLG